jgi:FMN phosphatase YigB (HAD superfamily)
MADRPVVCFDLGGVLLQIGHSWNEACAVAGVPEPDGRVGLNSFEPLVRYQAKQMDEDAYLAALGEWLGIGLPEARTVHESIILGDYPGAFELVKQLQSLGYFTCCFSNTNAIHWPVLTDPVRHPAIAALDRRFASQELGLAKPELASYRAVEEQLPAHDSVIFFEDTQENVLGAADAGWQAFRIDPFTDPIAQMRRTLGGLAILDGPVKGGC